MRKILRKIVTCFIDTRVKDVRKRIAKVAYQKHDADGYDVYAFICRDCGCDWDASTYAEHSFQDATCPNCYSEKVSITKLRLEKGASA